MNPTTRMSLLLSVLVFGMTLSCQSPNDPDPPVDPGPGVLALELTASPRLTSMQVKLSAHPADLPLDSLVLLRNDLPADTLRLTKPDTILSLTGLTPSTTYIWKVTGKKNTRLFSSNPLPTRTMDTTSHDFTWQVDTIGAPGSILWDVAIVNDTCVWVVGDILKYPYDSSDRYNAAMWNGKTWTKVRINTPIHPSGTLSPTIIYTILYVDGQLWITTDDGGYAVSDNYGKTWKPNRFPVESARGFLKRAWASSKSNIYWVGTNGSITHYDGKNFWLVESGTTMDLTDIDGTSNGSEIWVTGWTTTFPGGSVLLKIFENKVTTLWNYSDRNPDDPRQTILTNVWRNPIDQNWWVVGGNGQLFIHNRVLFSDLWIPGSYLTFSITGQSPASVFFAGEYGEIVHYNGSTWHVYHHLIKPGRRIYSIRSTGSLVAGVGYDSSGKCLIFLKK